MAEELDVQTNFRSQEWEQARDTLDGIFHRIFDILKSNPTLHALVDGRESEPQHKAGDFAVDHREGDIKLKMSDGKQLLEIGLSALGGTITAAQHGDLPGGTLHDLAVASTSAGFLSGTDKNKLDSLSNAVPFSGTPASVDASTGGPGASTQYARGDHIHQVATGTPVSIGTANAAGGAVTLARSNHVHDHGNLAGGALHAVATTGAAGFMSGADKAALNQWDGYTAGGGAPSPALGHFAFWHDGGVNTYLYFTGASGTKRVQLI